MVKGERMKATELRLGNIVTVNSGFVMRVTGILPDVVYLDFKEMKAKYGKKSKKTCTRYR